MDVRDLQVKRGDAILPAWQKLTAWAESLRVVPCPGMRLLVTPQGTHAVIEDNSTTWPHAWRVRVNGKDATIEEGTVNNRLPCIGETLLDGRNFGDPEGEAGEVPTLKLMGAESGKTWIALRAVVKNGVIEPGDPKALTVVEVPHLEPALTEGGAPDAGGVGLWPLAALYWRKGEMARIKQIVFLNLVHRFQAGTDGALGRHFFAAT
jgi:hypothetical protein